MFENIFRRLRKWRYKITYEPTNEYISGQTADNDIIAAIADKVATAASMFTPRIIRQTEAGTQVRDTSLSRLLAERPCPEYSTADFVYKLTSDLYRTSNALAIIIWNSDYTEVERIQPVTTSSMCILEGTDGEQYIRYVWDYDGNEYTVPLSQAIHIKGRLNKKRFLGTSPQLEIGKTTGIFDTLCKSVAAIAKNGTILRGILKTTNLVSDSQRSKTAEEFKEKYLDPENSGGIAVIDPRFEWQEINQKTINIPTATIEYFSKSLFRYYGMSEAVILGTAGDVEMGNFYESVIAPLALKLSLEFTYKLLSPRERARGNRIEFKADRLQYTSLQTRSERGKEMFDRGLITINEYRALMGYPAISDGDVRQISLNYVQTDNQNAYQLGQQGRSDEGGDENGKEDI